MVHDAVVQELTPLAFHWYELEPIVPLPGLIDGLLRVKLPPGQITSAGVLMGVATVGLALAVAVTGVRGSEDTQPVVVLRAWA